MSQAKKVENTVTIKAPASVVWDALIDPAKTKVYMYGCECRGEWKVGEQILWKGEHEGNKMVFVKSIVKAFEPNKSLVYTVIAPSMEDLPENHLNVTFTLNETEGSTVLNVVQDGFEGAEDGEKRYNDVYNEGKGWDPILSQIKSLLEGES